MADWAELHQDLLAFIAKRIGLLEDFISFARVCKSLRSVAVKHNFNASRQTPWLMLAEEEAENLITSDYRRFISITNRDLIGRIMLPEAKGKRCLESLGWFAVLSSVPSPSSKDYALMVIYEGYMYLGFWRPGDKTWTTIELHPRRPCHDIVFHKEQFYGLEDGGGIFACDVWGSNPTKAREVGQIGTLKYIGPKRLYIVESQGELLIVVRDGCDISFADEKDHESFMKGSLEETLYNFDEPRLHYGVQEFQVFKVDLLNDGWTSELIQSLGDNALFLGDNSSISIEASKFPGIRPNCIYYTVDNWEAYIWSK
ncbi:hypothetical protein RHSIM_Rhsim02G0226000 [Rhododendron simsii]|uniref:KIB1-4 beta-propeller domain-containing protein n=1 Tax=Rhododendron simsii TaxID=118357 RepID=A0A834LW89_RHOSS|nr:hypothetical protein RHSIM_Rhsim02G0226000 [Rhododendron simsii]